MSINRRDLLKGALAAGVVGATKPVFGHRDFKAGMFRSVRMPIIMESLPSITPHIRHTSPIGIPCRRSTGNWKLWKEPGNSSLAWTRPFLPIVVSRELHRRLRPVFQGRHSWLARGNQR